MISCLEYKMGEQFNTNNNSLTLIEQPTSTKAYFSEMKVTFQNGKMTTKTEIERKAFTNHVNTTRFDFNRSRGSLSLLLRCFNFTVLTNRRSRRSGNSFGKLTCPNTVRNLQQAQFDDPIYDGLLKSRQWTYNNRAVNRRATKLPPRATLC